MKFDPYSERNATQNPIAEILRAVGYVEISSVEANKQRGGTRTVVLKGILEEQLRKINTTPFSDFNIQKAVKNLGNSIEGLRGIPLNEKIYEVLTNGQSGFSERINGRRTDYNMMFIDWEKPENNVFHFSQEFTVSYGEGDTVRMDIVTFINGIPFGVIECKAPILEVEEGIYQILRYQKCVPELFKFVQLVVASNKHEVRYATVGTPRKFWMRWREEEETFLEKYRSFLPPEHVRTAQDDSILALFTPERVLEIMQFFVLFDAKVKKICRYQQYFAVKRVLETVEKRKPDGNRQGGVVWHTQGSGKSLTMVMLAKYLLTRYKNQSARVVVVTDRTELDGQITKTFAATGKVAAQAKSGSKLGELLTKKKADVITALIHKFPKAERDGKIEDSRDIFVLVDESHRTNYGLLATRMRNVLPNACFLAFTGTPLMKDENKNTMIKFGGLIHKYTIINGVEDEAIVPLVYESRYASMSVESEALDKGFEEAMEAYTERQKQNVKQKYGTMRRLLSTISRIQLVADDIEAHFNRCIKPTKFKALLATSSKRDAVRYLNYLKSKEGQKLRCEVLISGPSVPENIGEGENREKNQDYDESRHAEVNEFWDKMMARYGNDPDVYETAMKNEFKDGEIDILIVCSKLLTGYDAPICQVLYLDKDLREHALLQAIARTNRLHEGKDCGLILDYRGQIQELNDAMDQYSGYGLECFEASDIRNMMGNPTTIVHEMQDAYINLNQLFESIPDGLSEEERNERVEVLLGNDNNDDLRHKKFYPLLCTFGKKLNRVMCSEQAYKKLSEEERKHYLEEFIFYSKVRRSIKIRYDDAIDHAEFDPLIQRLLDEYVSADKILPLTNPVVITEREAFERELEYLGSLRAKADAIRNRLDRDIREKQAGDPLFYERFSKKIAEILDNYEKSLLTDSEYFSQMKEIMTKYLARESGITYPELIQFNLDAQAFWGVATMLLYDEDEKQITEELAAKIALKVIEIISENLQTDWEYSVDIKNQIEGEIDDYLGELPLSGVFLKQENIGKFLEQVRLTALARFTSKIA